ncbi:5-dehydro-2-deoxygluconokinase [Staphylococcus succinus]|uniref:5-dehydro-2-deoxygluconokinase n=1 Tax=Staphylococcus succinus TaxID=61015 RepID=A0ABX5IPL7_9STAP|nr:5-dehydro-2-deoxygluconokinase [Staphylococcus succinus]MBU0438939.1 5-dehydro-2-deoxygluconokinase [Staphylococcus succinus]MEB7463147.1 5-dehydro-2-deoxygluconokinase [Staphylococcus succinus]MEB8127764.1 5-dehydro-2-deoxygluconokinase [Staphylococcus succinus]MEB8210603.1 5-dehydro-2-deoxygluconokinase [Staphylococcus succinus]PKI21092.1 5-dehydro-2-deoxygluconokinase [Staphylococcus succinus]
MTTKKDIVAIGRAAIDLNAVEINRPMEETETFRKYVGGSPVNISIGASKLGLNVGLIANVSDDQHGRYITSYLDKLGVDTSQIHIDENGHKTGLTFTEIKSPSESNILMYREEASDLYLEPEHVSETYIKESEYLLISGTALAQSPSREAVLKALAIAKANAVKVVFEIDYRPYTWKTFEETSIYYELVAQQADIVIGTRDEYDMIQSYQDKTDQEIGETLFENHPELVVIKHGVQGSKAYTKTGEYFEGKAFKAKVIKTFGAGDSYAAAFLYALVKGKSIDEALKYGAASAAIVVSSHSSSEAMPTSETLENYISEHES